jgi:hypoxanthine-guanine phosphoribosyltransferase
MRSDLERILFDEPTIQRRLDKIAAQISNDYRDRDLTVIAILNGSLIFTADLLRRVRLPLRSTTRVCVLFSKKKERARYVDADYVGFEIEDEFVVVTGSISWNGIATFPISRCCGKN